MRTATTYCGCARCGSISSTILICLLFAVCDITLADKYRGKIMKQLTEKEQDHLFKALADFYAKTNTDKCPYETYMKAITLFDYLDTPSEEKIRYNSPNEKDICVAHMLALHYAV